jgi:hypothetical protein
MTASSDEADFHIVDTINTYNHAISIVKHKGYKIFLCPDESDSYLGSFLAIEGGRIFIASDPLRLLGLISIWEEYGDGWREANVTNEYDRILDRALPENDYEDLDESQFRELVRDYQLFFRVLDIYIPSEISRPDFVQLIKSFYSNAEE